MDVFNCVIAAARRIRHLVLGVPLPVHGIFLPSHRAAMVTTTPPVNVSLGGVTRGEDVHMLHASVCAPVPASSLDLARSSIRSSMAPVAPMSGGHPDTRGARR